MTGMDLGTSGWKDGCACMHGGVCAQEQSSVHAPLPFPHTKHTSALLTSAQRGAACSLFSAQHAANTASLMPAGTRTHHHADTDALKQCTPEDTHTPEHYHFLGHYSYKHSHTHTSTNKRGKPAKPGRQCNMTSARKNKNSTQWRSPVKTKHTQHPVTHTHTLIPLLALLLYPRASTPHPAYTVRQQQPGSNPCCSPRLVARYRSGP